MLVIIGLIVGGVLVGQNLIRSATTRAQITQIEKLNQAVNTFKGKYGELPGDMTPATAAKFGFTPRTPYPGSGPNNVGPYDGNGLLEAAYTVGLPGLQVGSGEQAMFWVDLTTANGMSINLTEGAFYMTDTMGADWFGPALDLFFPRAKIAPNHYIYAYSWQGYNWFGLSQAVQISSAHILSAHSSLPVAQAYAIDRKIDDGLPQTGNVLAMFLMYQVSPNYPLWAISNPTGWEFGPSGTAATPGGANTCYDNNNVGGATQQYSVTQNNGLGPNCALSFKFQ